jgi:hypothetical protein
MPFAAADTTRLQPLGLSFTAAAKTEAAKTDSILKQLRHA